MAASKAFIFYGGQLQMGDGANPEAFTAVTELHQVSFGGNKVDTPDVTHTQSVGGIREFIAGLQDGGECSFDANYIPGDAEQQSLQTAKDARAVKDFKVVLPNALGNITFSGIITALDRSLPLDKACMLSGKVKISGLPVYA